MTKRRAERVLPPEMPHKRCLRSLSNIDDRSVGAVTMMQNGNPPTPPSNARQPSRKRANHEDSLSTDDLPRKVSADKVNSVLGDENTCKSRKLEDAGEPVTQEDESNKQPDEQKTVNARDKVMHTDEELSAFNSFQFWRVPLPELDLSLLETEPTTGPNGAASIKDLEAMET